MRQCRAKKGGFILNALREATGPITARDITEAWCAGRGLKTDDTTWAIIPNRRGAFLTTLKNQGAVLAVSVQADGYKNWMLA